MNKKELINAISNNTGYTKKDISVVIDNMIDVIIDIVSSKEDVSITKFGKFTAVEREARIGRNPSTGESITLPTKRLVKFRPSATFKDTVNK